MSKIALFPGSFDPFTKGHENVVLKALPLFDYIYIGVGQNSTKQSFFTNDSKTDHICSLFSNFPKVKVLNYSKLTVELCKEIGASYLIRGLRDVKDFEYERSIAQMNHALDVSIETVFFVTNPELNHINSSIVRELCKHQGDISAFVTNSNLLVKS